jgi:hypothetical protein
MSLPKLNPVEPPWYGPVCPVVWEGWYREVSPYPDQQPLRNGARALYKMAVKWQVCRWRMRTRKRIN